MSLNFSIDSILRHSNAETSSSTLVSSNKLNQANFLKKQLNHQQLNTYLLSNGTSSATHSTPLNGLNATTNQLNNNNDTTPNTPSQLQSPLFYLNKAATNSTSVLSLMESVQTNGSTANSLNSSAFAFELNQLNHLSHLNSLELSRLNQLTQFQNQLTQFQSQLVVPYLSKINSLYNEESLNSSNGRPNSNQFNNNHTHLLNSNHHKLTSENSTSSKQQAAFLSSLAANGAAFSSNSGFNRTESQCSPMSDKSCEMLLNYEDSSDSNRMSQHSGNNVSINSNSSKHLNSLNSSNNNSSLNKDAPLCTKCKLHGIRNQVKGHKKNCPKKDCMCELCILTDYGKRLRGKKSKKAAAAAGLLLSSNTSSHANLTPTNLLMMDSLSEANNLSNLNHNLNNHLSNLNDGALFTTSTVANLHHQSSTPNSSSSSCSNLSMSNALAASLRNHPSTSSSTQPSNTATQQSSSSTSSNSILNQQLTNLHSSIGFLEKNALKDYIRIVISLLKEKLAQDGLNYEQELSRLKFAVIYLLLNRFDKKELFTKFMTDA